MDITLIVDTSSNFLAIGIVKGITVISQQFIAYRKQSEILVTKIDELLKKAKVQPKSITKIITTDGPGSYTGLRIAFTVCKTYAYALNIPLVVVSSYAIYAGDKTGYVVIDAHNDLGYLGYLEEGKLISSEKLSKDEIIKKVKDQDIYGETSFLGILSSEVDIIGNIYLASKNALPVENILKAKLNYD
jgi:tRNA threonylcarbamoyl adenosine modification protein YeaZ